MFPNATQVLLQGGRGSSPCESRSGGLAMSRLHCVGKRFPKGLSMLQPGRGTSSSSSPTRCCWSSSPALLNDCVALNSPPALIVPQKPRHLHSSGNHSHPQPGPGCSRGRVASHTHTCTHTHSKVPCNFLGGGKPQALPLTLPLLALVGD